jgi:hypothetical protein
MTLDRDRPEILRRRDRDRAPGLGLDSYVRQPVTKGYPAGGEGADLGWLVDGSAKTSRPTQSWPTDSGQGSSIVACARQPAGARPSDSYLASAASAASPIRPAPSSRMKITSAAPVTASAAPCSVAPGLSRMYARRPAARSFSASATAKSRRSRTATRMPSASGSSPITSMLTHTRYEPCRGLQGVWSQDMLDRSFTGHG